MPVAKTAFIAGSLFSLSAENLNRRNEDAFMARKSGSHFVMLKCKYALLAKQVVQVLISSRKKLLSVLFMQTEP